MLYTFDLNIDSRRKENINNVVNNVKNISVIKRIILFGSCARDKAHKYSDIDILIVTKGNELSEEVEDDITDKVYNLDNKGKDINAALDLLIMSEEMFNRTKDKCCSVTKQINSEGVILWEN